MAWLEGSALMQRMQNHKCILWSKKTAYGTAWTQVFLIKVHPKV